MTFHIKGKDYLLRALMLRKRVEALCEWFFSRGEIVSLLVLMAEIRRHTVEIQLFAEMKCSTIEKVTAIN